MRKPDGKRYTIEITIGRGKKYRIEQMLGFDNTDAPQEDVERIQRCLAQQTVK